MTYLFESKKFITRFTRRLCFTNHMNSISSTFDIYQNNNNKIVKYIKKVYSRQMQ